MKTYRFIAVAILALFFASCGKDGNGRIRISAEWMKLGGAKVYIEPTQVNKATWVDGETVNLNGSTYFITKVNDKFYIDAEDNLPTAPYYAIYPSSIRDAVGNNVSVINNGSSGEVVMRSLGVNFHDSGHDVIFPMKAHANREGSSLLFQHLTGGLQLTLTDTSGANITLASVKVIARSTSEVTPISLDGISARWDGQGPNVPSGTIGENDDDVDIKYSCEMNFILYDDGDANVSFPGSGSRSFCIPVTVSSIHYLTVIGYSPSGVELFRKTKDLGTDKAVARNTMYNIPTIKF